MSCKECEQAQEEKQIIDEAEKDKKQSKVDKELCKKYNEKIEQEITLIGRLSLL